MAITTIDPRIQVGAYIKRGMNVYLVIGPERDEKECVTGMTELEPISGRYSSYGNGRGIWVYPKTVVSSTEIAMGFELIKHAPIISHLADTIDVSALADNDPVLTQTGLPAVKNYGRTGGRLSPPPSNA